MNLRKRGFNRLYQDGRLFELLVDNGIWVDEFARTEDPRIFDAGDCAIDCNGRSND